MRVPQDDARGFFLTPNGEKPSCDKFQSISWGIIADVFEMFAEEAKAPMVSLFAQHYSEALRHDIVSDTQIEDKNYAEPIA